MPLQPPQNFNFPYSPYSIQHQFMKSLYETIERKKIGIFESPTGTGKSLSIICGALQWLQDYNEYERNRLPMEIEFLEDEKADLTSENDDWIKEQTETIKIQAKINELKLQESEIDKYDKKIQKLFSNKKKKYEKKRVFESKIQKKEGVEEGKDEDEIFEDDMLIEESKEGEDREEEEEQDERKFRPVQIFICSRTHSQLSQLVGEIKKSPYKSTRVVTLASRQNYCVNPDVQRLKNVTLINEKCLDLQGKKSKSTSTKTDPDGRVLKRQKGTCECPFNKQMNIEELRDAALVEIQDIEELVVQGKEVKGCPYYATRKAVEDAEIVLVPYNNLLHRHTREASGIKLKNNIVIIDEAHNLLEAVAQMYGAELTLLQLEETRKRLQAYQQKFSTRFSTQNLLSIKQLLFIITKLVNVLKLSEKENEEAEKTFTVESFVLTSEIDCFNTYKLIQFCTDSKIAQKLHSYSKKYPAAAPQPPPPKHPKKLSGLQEFLSKIEKGEATEVSDAQFSQVPREEEIVSLGGNPFLAFISFLECLQYSYEDGRIIVYKRHNKKESKLKFLVLNPAIQLADMINDARSVIFAGGTMKPIPEFRNGLQKAANVPTERFTEFTCDHIVPAENILPLIITRGLKQETLTFNYENRFKLGTALKEILPRAIEKIKGGVVVFFPSYKYEEWVWKQLEGVKFDRSVFREPKESGSVDSVLESYASAIRKPNSPGALLFSVVGGKLSEGLNFSDELGRCVVVVGLPYANIKSPELQEKMKYLEVKESSSAAQRFYESLCMKSVNQCIGRAIRHREDYACVLLLDSRYDRKATKEDFPDWIKKSIRTCSTFPEALELTEKFFKERRGLVNRFN